MSLSDQLRRRAQELGVTEELVLGAALAREALVCFFRAFPDEAIFVGGNVLHLLYGSPRYSRDVDLLPRRELHRAALSQIAHQLEHRLQPFANLLGESIICRAQTPESSAVEVRLAGRRIITLEFSRIAGSVRQRETKLLQSESLASEVVVCPVLDEMLFLKLRVLLKRRFFKARDVFDLWYLLSLGAKADTKEFAHWLAVEEIEGEEIQKRLGQITPRRLEQDLASLLPSPWLKKFRADNYASVIHSVITLLKQFAQP